MHHKRRLPSGDKQRSTAVDALSTEGWVGVCRQPDARRGDRFEERGSACPSRRCQLVEASQPDAQPAQGIVDIGLRGNGNAEYENRDSKVAHELARWAGTALRALREI